MPTYYFDIYDGRTALCDEVGTVLPNVAEAADEAAALLPEFARETLPGQQAHQFAASVRDEAGQVVYRAMMLFQGQAVPDQHRPYVTVISGARFQLTRRAELRAEAKALSERLAQNVEGLLNTFEELRAKMEASRQVCQRWPNSGA